MVLRKLCLSFVKGFFHKKHCKYFMGLRHSSKYLIRNECYKEKNFSEKFPQVATNFCKEILYLRMFTDPYFFQISISLIEIKFIFEHAH